MYRILISALKMSTSVSSEQGVPKAIASRYYAEALTCEDDFNDWAKPLCSGPGRRHTGRSVTPTTVSRNIRIDYDAESTLVVLRSASVDDAGETVHYDDLPAQIKRTFTNLSNLLQSVGALWSDVVRTTWFVRNLAQDGPVVIQVLTMFCASRNVPYPSVTPAEAILCRDDLLVEAEAVAIVPIRGRADCNPPAG